MTASAATAIHCTVPSGPAGIAGFILRRSRNVDAASIAHPLRGDFPGGAAEIGGTDAAGRVAAPGATAGGVLATGTIVAGAAASCGDSGVSFGATGWAAESSFGRSARIRSVTRRLRWRPSAVSLVSTGWFSAKPTARKRAGSTPLAAKSRTTELARAPESSQFEGYSGVWIGRLSV